MRSRDMSGRNQLTLAGDSGAGLSLLDKELGLRPATSITTPETEPGAE